MNNRHESAQLLFPCLGKGAVQTAFRCRFRTAGRTRRRRGNPAPSLSLVPNAFQAAGRKILSSGTLCIAHRDAQHRAHGDQIRADMAVADRAVIRAPVVHHVVRRLERAAVLTVAARGEPGARPGVVGALPKRIGNLVRQVASSSPRRSAAPARDPSTRFRRIIVAGISRTRDETAKRIRRRGNSPGRRSSTSSRARMLFAVLFRHVPPLLHHGLSVFIALLRRQASRQAGAGVDQVDNAAGFLRPALELIAGRAFRPLRGLQYVRTSANICARLVSSFMKSIPRPLSTSFSVARMYGSRAPFQSNDVLRSASAKSAVRIEVRPLALSLEARSNVRYVRPSPPRSPREGCGCRS